MSLQHNIIPAVKIPANEAHRLPSYYRQLKHYHLQHHYSDYANGFGVTSRFWDRVFGTELEVKAAKAA